MWGAGTFVEERDGYSFGEVYPADFCLECVATLSTTDTVIGMNLKLSETSQQSTAAMGHVTAASSKSAPANAGAAAGAAASRGGSGEAGRTSTTATSPLLHHIGTQTVSIMDLFGFQSSKEVGIFLPVFVTNQ